MLQNSLNTHTSPLNAKAVPRGCAYRQRNFLRLVCRGFRAFLKGYFRPGTEGMCYRTTGGCRSPTPLEITGENGRRDEHNLLTSKPTTILTCVENGRAFTLSGHQTSKRFLKYILKMQYSMLRNKREAMRFKAFKFSSPRTNN